VSNLANVVGAVIALAAINRLLDRNDKVAPTQAPKPLIKQGFVTGPAAGSQDFTLIKPMVQITPAQLQAFKPQTPAQQAFTRERITAPSGTPEQAALIAQAYRPGKVTPLGYRPGETTDDLLRRLFNNPRTK
tara:strand:+ start:674 stop:1069 length:396 start_codon:yes stop_codon:yes gene_type:complete